MKPKPKKTSSSGFGSSKSSLNTSHHKNCSNSSSTTKNSRKDPTIRDKEKLLAEDDDKDLNSGFGDYIRSPEAIEMMKLFVLANTIVIILTMAWPNLKETYSMFEEWWFYKSQM